MRRITIMRRYKPWKREGKGYGGFFLIDVEQPEEVYETLSSEVYGHCHVKVSPVIPPEKVGPIFEAWTREVGKASEPGWGLSESEQELKKLEKRHCYTHLFDRVKMSRVLKSGECRNLGEAAQQLGYSWRQCQRWFALYSRGGLKELLVCGGTSVAVKSWSPMRPGRSWRRP
jgi:hypothetical protein